MNLAELYKSAAAGDPARPFMTFYDDATSERTELSYATFENWVSKTANFLVDQAGLGSGDKVKVAMPPHWLSGAIMFGSWYAGIGIAHEAVKTDIGFRPEGDPALDTAEECVVCLAPLATRLRAEREVQRAERGEIIDFLTEVRGHGDHFTSAGSVDGDAPALVALPGDQKRSHSQVVEAAQRRAQTMGIGQGERILISGDELRPLDWLLAPLAAKGSIVLCRNSGDADLTSRADSERARIIAV